MNKVFFKFVAAARVFAPSLCPCATGAKIHGATNAARLHAEITANMHIQFYHSWKISFNHLGFLANNPEMQQEIYDELYENIYALTRNNLNKLSAFIYELQTHGCCNSGTQMHRKVFF